MLTVRNLRKAFATDKGLVQAVDGVSFEIQRGEFYTLLGPSGCGKTTTLQCIAGLETPDDGEIALAGDLVYSRPKRLLVPAHRRNIGMVFQSYAIWPHMNVFQNVAFPLQYGRRRLPKQRIDERVRKALNMVQLGEYGNRPAPFLSGGQQQRVALARAIVDEPKVLLLDEPLSNLDAKLREEMRVELRDLVTRLNITTLYVTHDQIEALSMSDRIAVMRDGNIVQESTPREIYLTPKDKFVADFLGKSNFLEARISEYTPGSKLGTAETEFGPLQCTVTFDAKPGDRVLLAVRPAGIQVGPNGAAGDRNTFRGQLESISFVGDFLECQVQVGSVRLRIILDPYREFRVGQTIALSIPGDRLATVAKL
ncbi:MAG: ABC transporter ATP-binding protein [Deltaproteobacteria bacterium]|nr:ABC transporter ATP-binding protein [Deltaproteobacteria bacterium]